MINILMSLGQGVRSFIVIVLLLLVCLVVLALLYRLVRYGIKLRATVGAASVEIDTTEEAEQEHVQKQVEPPGYTGSSGQEVVKNE